LPSLFIDSSYHTMLGVPFHDRIVELEDLKWAVEKWRTILVYGPRNVGKSELVRYFARKQGFSTIMIDAREKAVRSLGLNGPSVKEVLEELARLLAKSSSLVKIIEAIAKTTSRLACSQLLTVIDEFHLLFSSPSDATSALEAVAGWLAKRGVEKNVLIVVSSEGFMTKPAIASRLRGYATWRMLVEALDDNHMRHLYQAYSRIASCRLDAETFIQVFGGAPGYLVEACKLERDELLEHYLPTLLYETLDQAIAVAARRTGLRRRHILGIIAQLLTVETTLQQLAEREPAAYEVAEALIDNNIAYLCSIPGHGDYLLPQLPVCTAAAKEAAEAELDTASRVKPEKLLEHPKPPLCRQLQSRHST
jgi:hypothetical protein